MMTVKDIRQPDVYPLPSSFARFNMHRQENENTSIINEGQGRERAQLANIAVTKERIR